MMERQSIYWRDEFAVEIGLTANRNGETVPADIPPFDWGARIFTPDSTRHVAISQKDGVAHGWSRTDDGKILVRLDRHGLLPGPLVAEFTFLLPDGGYPDGNQRLTRHYDLGVDLTTDDRDVPTAAEATLKVPWQLIKGEPGKDGECVPVGWVELVTDQDSYLVPLCGEKAKPKPAPSPEYGYGYGYYWGSDTIPTWGTWDIDMLNETYPEDEA